MRAVVCKELGPPSSLVVDEVPDPEPGEGQVVIDVHACGVNFPDTLIIQGRYQFQPPLPFSPGGEVAGVVSAVGPGVDGLREGDRVIAVTGFGGFAEKVAVGATQVIPMPDAMDFRTGSAFLFTYGTTIYAFRERASLASGETLLVLGAAGGTGLSAVELGAALGAQVIAAASSEGKLALCRERGASEGVDYSKENLRERIKELTGGRGVDVCYDPVGGDLAEAAIRGMGWGGRYLVIGFTAGIPKIPLNLVLLKSCQIVGVFWGAFHAREPARHRELVDELFDLWAAGKIAPHVSAAYPLERAADALEDVLARRALGKLVIEPRA